MLGTAAAIVLGAYFLPALLKGRPAPVAPENQEEMPSADLAGFNRDCVRAVLDSNTVPPGCANLAAMQAAYRVDALRLLEDGRGRMIMTARRIARGDIASDSAYNQCLAAGDCAPVPVLPPGVGRDSPEGRAARAAFQRLLDGGALNAQMCDELDICRALVRIGIVKQQQPQ